MEESISYHNTKVYTGNCNSSYWYKSYILHCTGEGWVQVRGGCRGRINLFVDENFVILISLL